MTAWDEAEELLNRCVQMLDGPPPDEFAKLGSIREQMLWLMAKEAEHSHELKLLLVDWFAGDDIDLRVNSPSARWLLFGRFHSCAELMWELPSLDLRKWVEKDLAERGMLVLAQWLIQGWEVRAEGAWLRFCARRESGQIWVDDTQPPGG